MLQHLDFQLDKLEARKHHARVEGKRIVLPQHIRLALLRGERPAITCWGREPCPIRVGMEYRLAPNFTLLFTEIRRNRKGHHRCVALVRDHRPLTLQTRPTDSDSRRRERINWTPEEEHGYSRSADVLDAGDVLDPIDQAEIDKQAMTRGRQQAILDRATRAERYELEQRLARVRERAEHERIDISSDVRVITKRIEALERRVMDKAA